MNISIEDVAAKCVQSIDEQMKNLKTINILVAGQSGVGKSTLINSVFREDVTKTGYGKAVTTKISKKSKPGFPLCIYDTPGLELNPEQQKEITSEIRKIISDGNESQEINNMIHCMWYCINVNSGRIQESELQWLKSFIQENELTHIPVLIILTQAYSMKKAKLMIECLENEQLSVMGIIPVVAKKYVIDLPTGEAVCEPYGLETIIETMLNELPDEIQNTLINVQNVSLELKRKRAENAIAIAVATGEFAGYIPLPLVDLGVFLAGLSSMIARINTIYGISSSESVIANFMTHSLSGFAGFVLGNVIIKSIPGIGTVIGGTVTGAFAGVLAYALGKTYIRIIEGIYKGEMNSDYLLTNEGKRQVRKWMKEEMAIIKRNR